MIQLATDPQASRSNWRPADEDGKGNPMARRGRPGHAWPFISRPVERPAGQPASQNPSGASGS